MKVKGKNLLTVGEIAREAGLLPSTIRYYSKIGLLRVAEYSPGGFRLFDREEALARLKEIRKIVGQRVSLEEVKERLSEERISG